MKNEMKATKIMVLALVVSALLIGCGNSSDTKGNSDSGTQSEGSESNIPYLKQNHANYAEHGSQATPAPTKDASAKSIDWTISASTKEGAEKLSEHINYMIGQLKEGKNPRAFDKLFLMEAYMKVNHYYTTSVERTGTLVVISKNATTACAYEVISAHSDAVSGDFFGKGDINNDYSSIAEAILASASWTSEKSAIESYIKQKQKSRNP
jgi:hypothetical protein